VVALEPVSGPVLASVLEPALVLGPAWGSAPDWVPVAGWSTSLARNLPGTTQTPTSADYAANDV